jgi:hypothetical protein
MKVLYKSVKYLDGREVLYGGIPVSSLQKALAAKAGDESLPANWPTTQAADGQWRWEGITIDTQAYQAWRQAQLQRLRPGPSRVLEAEGQVQSEPISAQAVLQSAAAASVRAQS